MHPLMQNMDAHTNTHVCNHACGQRFKLTVQTDQATRAQHTCTHLHNFMASIMHEVAYVYTLWHCMYVCMHVGI